MEKCCTHLHISQTSNCYLSLHTGNYTLFLPSDAAFRRLPRWFRDSLEVDKKLKKALLLNHLVKEDLPLSVLENEELVLSARPGGNRLRINIFEPENTYVSCLMPDIDRLLKVNLLDNSFTN